MKVTLRTKPLKDGSQSLYLDVYEDGKRRYEYLRLYLIPEVDENAKRLNANALKKANELKSKYILGQGSLFQSKKKESSMTMQDWLNEYARRITEERDVSSATRQQTELVKTIMEKYLCAIKKKNIKLAQFGKKEVRGFLLFLSEYKGERVEHFSKNTLMSYQQRIVAILNAAVHDGQIPQNPYNLLTDEERFEKPHATKEGLSIEEVKKIATTKHSNNQVRMGFLFSCFTGLRLSDIRSLKWSDIVDMGSYKAVIKEQKKTRKQVAVPLCNTALLFLPEQQNDEFVFHLPKYTWLNGSLKRIVKAAGISKQNVSFHTARHTFATLTQSACKNLKVVGGLLGHESIESTQRYVTVVSESCTEAIDKLGSTLG